MHELMAQIDPDMNKTEYYKTLLSNSEQIIQNIGLHGKIATGAKLGMSSQAFSTFYPILIAHLEILNDQSKN